MACQYYGCRPLVVNVPTGHPGWVETECPECGQACWKRPDEQELIALYKEMGRPMTFVCTECALRKGLRKDG